MSKLTREEVLRLASLSNLSLSEAETEQFMVELGDILDYVDKLQAVDVTGLEPTYQVSGLKNSMRTDEVRVGAAKPNELLKNVPRTSSRYIQVGRMI